MISRVIIPPHVRYIYTTYSKLANVYMGYESRNPYANARRPSLARL